MRAVAAVLVAIAVAGCGATEERSTPPEPAPAAVGPASGGHIHGLGVNPRDGSLFIATHDGMYRAARDSDRPRRVGRRRQDTMGFTVVGRDRFLGSGHPDLNDDLPPFLGLIRSRDAGRTWTPVSLLGKADFHALEAAGRRVYGAGSDWETRTPRFLTSSDGGRTWQRRRPPEPPVSIAVDPTNVDRLVVAGQKGLSVSADGGRSWRPTEGPPSLVAFAGADRLFAVDAEGVVRMRQGGQRWTDVGDVGGAPAAFEVTEDGDLLVALHDGAINRSGDGGRTWRVRARL